MKTLNITLTIKATNYSVAETFGKNELMELAKIIGMKSRSCMASCAGNTNYVADGVYEVEATVQIDGRLDVTEIIKEAQRNWNANPNIISNTVFVVEEQNFEPVQKEKQYEPCECCACGQVMVKGYQHTINRNTDIEYYLCNSCFEYAIDEDEVIECQCCDEYINVDNLVPNPVTGKKDLCPCCGNKIEY